MKLRARTVLEDCKGALGDLQDGVQGNEWRRKWVASVVLLRTVGHVLKRVDAQSDPKLEETINSEWENLQKSKPEPKIFWEFIEHERNNIIKQYEINAGQGVTVNVAAGSAEYHYPITAGPFAGRDQREILSMAIEWWENYLKKIEGQI